jgi:uncharacterized protein (TIGR00369 family)
MARPSRSSTPASNSYDAVDVHPGGCTVRLNADDRHLQAGRHGVRPCPVHAGRHRRLCLRAVHAGPDALSVTTSLNINFMRKAGPGPIDGHCRILKLGRSLMVFDCEITQNGQTIAHATGTYSIPPRR